MVSDTVKQQILERQRQQEAAEDAPEMTLVQTAAVQRDIASILLPGESVAKGLQRLGAHHKRPAGTDPNTPHSEAWLTACYSAATLYLSLLHISLHRMHRPMLNATMQEVAASVHCCAMRR